MLGKKKFEPKLMYNLTMEELVPVNNFYRRLDDLLDLRFLYQECKNLYGSTGNPSLDPVVFFKLALFGYFENITSDHELIRRAGDSLGVRYYMGYDIDEKLPWHSTISRTRILIKQETFELLFTRVLDQCYRAGMVEGKHQSIDSVLVKANASTESLERKEPELKIEEFVSRVYKENIIEELEEKTDSNDDSQLRKVDPGTDKSNSGKKKRVTDKNKNYTSTTDPDSRLATKPGKPSEMYYSTHYGVDSLYNIVTDVLTTHADRRDSLVLIEVYQRAEKRLNTLGLKIEEVSADRGYCSGENLRKLEEKQVTAYIPSHKQVNNKGGFDAKKFKYQEQTNTFICPNNKELKFQSYDKQKQSNRYICKAEYCSVCPFKEQCCPNSEKRNLRRTIYHKEYENLEQRLKTPRAREAHVIRKTRTEPLFAEAKMYHGLSKFMVRGIDKCQKISFMIATVQNIKRLLSFRKKALNKVNQKIKSVADFTSVKNDFVFQPRLGLPCIC